jgi:hypothetical protein
MDLELPSAGLEGILTLLDGLCLLSLALGLDGVVVAFFGHRGWV